jgi:hypothetical protein
VISRPLRAAAVLLLLTGTLLLAGPSGAGAATVDAVAWWWRPQTSSLPARLPGPPNVGPEQLLVEGQPQDANAVAAMRFTLAEGEGSPVLTLEPASTSAPLPADAVVLACRAAGPWAPDAVGPWEAKPVVDCATSVQGIPTGDGGLAFALTPLVGEGGSLDVVLTPGRVAGGPEGANGSTFSLVLDKPGPEALATSPGATSTGGTFGNDALSSPSIDQSTDAAFDGGSSAFAGPPAFTPPSAAAAVPALTPQEQVPLVTQTGSGVQAASSYDGGTRALGVIVLVLGLALALWSWGVPLQRMRPATEEPPETMGGLGRFARLRQGTPPSLV